MGSYPDTDIDPIFLRDYIFFKKYFLRFGIFLRSNSVKS